MSNDLYFPQPLVNVREDRPLPRRPLSGDPARSLKLRQQFLNPFLRNPSKISQVFVGCVTAAIGLVE